MNIKGLDYNTQRAKLIMSEYGREIQKMVEYACEPAYQRRTSAMRQSHYPADGDKESSVTR